MKTEDIDVSESQRVQIDQGMINEYDVVVNMAEKEYSPDWLLESPKCLYWDIKDPRHLGYEGTLETKNEIKQLVLALIGQLTG